MTKVLHFVKHLLGPFFTKLVTFSFFNNVNDRSIIRADDQDLYIFNIYFIVLNPCKKFGHNLKVSWPPIPLTSLEKERAHFYTDTRRVLCSCCLVLLLLSRLGALAFLYHKMTTTGQRSKGISKKSRA